MQTIPRSPRIPSLSASEREVIVTFNDAERTWRVYSDSATMRGAVLRLARQLGAEIRRVGSHGVEFDVPADALRLTAKRRSRRPSEESLKNLRRSLKRPDSIGGAEGKVGILAGVSWRGER